jgi:UDP-N-acetylglucosamine 2-epimerase (non-hydrolysing)
MVEVCLVVGARPNFMKAAPVYAALQALGPEHQIVLVHTGQHYVPEMSDVFLEELGLPTPDEHLGIGSGTHAQQTARTMVAFEEVLLRRRPELVVVFGDVNSTLAAALAAAKLGVPIAHVESGLRSFDLSMPEELNRKLTDHLSSILFVHSESAIENLEHEGLGIESVYFVGNTMIDSLLEHLERARERRPWRHLGVAGGEYGLVTLHRPELVDDSELLAATISHIVELGESHPLVFPVHPRTWTRIVDFGVERALSSSRVVVCEPLGYLDFLGLEAEARFVLTDSGGIQEEASALGVRCFTMRDTTERPVTLDLGTNTLLGREPTRIAGIPSALDRPQPSRPIPLWDGKAGVRTAKVLLELFADGLETGGSRPQFRDTEPAS